MTLNENLLCLFILTTVKKLQCVTWRKTTELVHRQKTAHWSGIGRGKRGSKYFGGTICGKWGMTPYPVSYP